MGLALGLGTQGMKPEQVSTANELGRLQTPLTQLQCHQGLKWFQGQRPLLEI